jgi:hypothetical protein
VPIDAAGGNRARRCGDHARLPSDGRFWCGSGTVAGAWSGDALVTMIVPSLRGDDQQELLSVLDLLDAVHHARAATCPVLCKLALRDDVVPAPSAAAVFNALASPQNWAFWTRFGHYDGGIADARRHELFERVHPAFADPVLEAARVVGEITLKTD